MIRRKPTKTKLRVRARISSVPCPHCGAPSRVLRTTLGERLRTSARSRDFVLRERRCLSRAHHRFTTEEHSK